MSVPETVLSTIAAPNCVIDGSINSVVWVLSVGKLLCAGAFGKFEYIKISKAPGDRRQRSISL